jgi:osmotically-inducible protein OsmY
MMSAHEEELVMKSDLELKQDVVAELEWERAIRSDKIVVNVLAGVVMLTGNVGSYSEKLTAERAVRRVSEVIDLVNEVRVHLIAPDCRTDKELQKSSDNALRSLAHLPKDSIKVTVVEGLVTLAGEVDWQCQKNTAMNNIAQLYGVQGIQDQITIKVGETSRIVQSEIEAALERCALAYARVITVQVSGSNVTLSGRVSSWSERELAKQAAWSSPGVLKVIDQMVASY